MPDLPLSNYAAWFSGNLWFKTPTLAPEQANFENDSSEAFMGADVQHNYPWLTWANAKFNFTSHKCKWSKQLFSTDEQELKHFLPSALLPAGVFKRCWYINTSVIMSANESKDEVWCWTGVINISCVCVVHSLNLFHIINWQHLSRS